MAVKRGNSWRIQPSKVLSDGTLVRTSITAPTKKEADRLAALWYEQQEESRSKRTLGDAIDDYINSCEKSGASPSTIKEYTSRRKNSYPDIIDTRLDKLTADMIQSQIDSRLETISIKTARNDFFLLKPVLALYAPTINLSRIKLGKKPKRKKLRMQESWKTEIPIAVSRLYGKKDFYLYILFLIYTGIRPCEAYALTWSDISEEPIKQQINDQEIQLGYIDISKDEIRTKDNQYQVKPPKTESGIRTLIIDWSFFEELYFCRPREQDTEKIFKVNPYCNDRKWKRIKQELHLPDELRQYDLRHFHATDIAYSGASEEEIMERMGHSSSAFSHSVYIELFAEHSDSVNISLAEKTRSDISALHTKKHDF